jgi:uncharacterized membrane protein YdjX (TVP38/TMEM64 family)
MSKLEESIAPGSIVQRHGQKLLALLLWAILLTAYLWYAAHTGFRLQDGLINGRTYLYAPLVYILLFALRPLIFFPASLLAIAAGLMFGVVGGIFYATIGANLSALVAFLVGRYFGRGLLEGGESSNLAQRYALRMRRNSFETVLIMRLLLLPYDFVNYLSGFLRINSRAFVLATLIGSLPANISLVLIGVAGNLDELAAGKFSINPWALAGSVLLVGVSLTVSRLLRRRENRPAA